MTLNNFLGYYAGCLELQKELKVENHCFTNSIYLSHYHPNAKLVHGILGKVSSKGYDNLPHTWLEIDGQIIECSFEWLGTDYKYYHNIKDFIDDFKKKVDYKKRFNKRLVRQCAGKVLTGLLFWLKLGDDDDKEHYEDGDMYEMYSALIEPTKHITNKCGIIAGACSNVIVKNFTAWLREQK